MRPSLVLVIGATLLAVPATAGADPVRYSVALESPGATAVGTVAVRAVVSGGVSQPQYQPKYGAYHIRTLGPWTEEERFVMDRVGDKVFEAPLPTDLLPNDTYRVEVRVWGDLPPYDPRDHTTFSRFVTEVAVDNPPAAPTGVQAATPSTALRLGWTAVDTADREDFAGYRVLHREGACSADPAAYAPLGDVRETLFISKLEPGRYCLRVAAVRSSPVSGEILSALSEPARVVLDRAVAAPILPDIVTASGEAPVPPQAPKLPDPNRAFTDARYAEDLPYDGPVTTRVAVPAQVQEAAAVDPGPDPRQGPMLVAVGLALTAGSLLLRRFLKVPRS